MPNQGALDAGGKFEDLLLQLREQHEKEVFSLRDEVRKYQAQAADHRLPGSPDQASLRIAANSKATAEGEPQLPSLNLGADRDAGKKSTVKFPNEAGSPGHLSPARSGGKSNNFSAERTLADLNTIEGEQKAKENGFALKDSWAKIPVQTGSWGQELDKIMVTQQAQQLIGRVKDDDVEVEQVEDRRKRRSRIAGTAATMREDAAAMFAFIKVDPSSTKRVCWDLAGLLLIAFDMISIPFSLSFEPDDHPFTDFMGWVTLLFWTTDVFCSLLTGYYEDGKLVMARKKIVKHYLKGWFWIDMIVVVPDWVMKLMGSMTSVAGLGRILRIFRIMRVLRMLRLLKLKKLLALVYDMIDSEYMWIIFSLIRLLTLLLVMNHIVACIWYGVGRLSRDSYEKNWLEDAGATPVYDKDLGWKYLTSLHWSITQFTPASMDVSATNNAERLFSIIILFWALVALSSVIGNVSSAMTALRTMSGDEMQKFWMLRRYLKQKGISKPLQDRVVKYLEYEVASKKDKVPVAKVALLVLISDNLRLELAKEINAPLLECHPFFTYISEEIPALMFKLCYTCLSTAAYAESDNVFSAGNEGVSMYFLRLGQFEYTLADGHKLDHPLGPKTWASEAVLWTTWRHRGTLTANVPGEGMIVNPDKFIEVFAMHPRPWHLGQHYGAHFVEYMNDEYYDRKLSDIIFDEGVFTMLVEKSKADDAIKRGETEHKLEQERLQKLEEEKLQNGDRLFVPNTLIVEEA